MSTLRCPIARCPIARCHIKRWSTNFLAVLGDVSLEHAIMVDNPARLYGF